MSDTRILILQSREGDRVATEKLIEENSGLIWAVAKRYIGRGTDTEDLYQLGCVGFLKAIEGYDPDYGTQFSTYAVPKIAGEIRRFLRDDGTVKVSRTIKERAVTIRTVRNQFLSDNGYEPSLNQIAEITCFTPEEIAEAESAAACVESINREYGEEGFSLESVLTDTQSEEKLVEQIALRQAIDTLPERESMVIRLRYYHGLTQEKVSGILGVSQVQVSRVEKKALFHLKEILI